MEVSEDEGTASEPLNKSSGATVEELEEEIKELEKSLKSEREERKRQKTAAQDEMEKEIVKAEEIWMERARQAMQVGSENEYKQSILRKEIVWQPELNRWRNN